MISRLFLKLNGNHVVCNLTRHRMIQQLRTTRATPMGFAQQDRCWESTITNVKPCREFDTMSDHDEILACVFVVRTI